jgi:hypothetical protein
MSDEEHFMILMKMDAMKWKKSCCIFIMFLSINKYWLMIPPIHGFQLLD